jgi:hypothetical protein
VYVHGAAACVTVNVCPPAVMVPVRGVVVELAATLKVTAPLPEPLAPPVMVIQLALLVAFHVHPADVVTVTAPVPPSASTDWDVGEIVYVHGAAACVTVNVCPPAVMVPVRGVVVELAATLKVTVPLPEPLAPPVMVIQLALFVAVHVHPADVVTVNEPVLPPDGAAWDVGVSVYVQVGAVPACVTTTV